MKVIISAAGTGGHIYPALSIINKIREQEPTSEFLYIGTTDRMESKLVPELGINYLGIDIIGLHKDLSIFKSLFLFTKAIKICRKKIKEFNPDIVIGAGGYVTAPVIYAAKKEGFKTAIHEQNSIPGKSNTFLEKYTDKIFLSLPNSKKYFKSDKTILTGNPRGDEAYNASQKLKKDLGFDDKKLVVIVMGSLGSETINSELLKSINIFKEKNYNILIITGEKHYELFSNLELPKNVKIKPFMKDLINYYKSIDLIVSRAGASTIAEILAVGLPSILVPSPYVANNHQFYNAKELSDNNASVMLEEKAFNGENLVKSIDNIFNDEKKYQQMSQNAYKMGIRDSNTIIYKEIKKITRG